MASAEKDSLEASNDTSLASAHLEAVNNIVKKTIDSKPSYVANNTEKVVKLYRNTCPGNCSNNGHCTDTSECDCFGFFHGQNCDIDERNPLIIDDIEGGGECDLAHADQCLCFHVRSSNILEGFKCRFNVSKVNVNGNRELVSTKYFRGGYENIFTGVCCIQDNIISTDGVFVSKYDISISNDGIMYGNNKSVYVFDSTCQEAKFTSSENALFSLKTGFCFIDGVCAAENEMSSVGCFACQSSIDAYNWTVYNPCRNEGSCIDETEGYTCVCEDGYGGKNCELETKSMEKSQILKFARASVNMIFPITSNFDTESALKDNITKQLMTVFKSHIREAFKGLFIKHLRFGSLYMYVDFKLIYDNTTTSMDIMEANIAFLSGEETIEVINETVSATSLTINDIVVTNETFSDDNSLCNIYEALNGVCPYNRLGSVVDRKPSCGLNGIDEKTDMTSVVAVTMFASVILLIVVLITCLSIC